MHKEQRYIEFYSCIEDIVNHPKVQQMNDISQHVKGVSCLDHCLFVSYLSFSICKKLGFDAKSAARGALLHDLYLCHWENTNIGVWKRLLIHPKMAAKNADIFSLSHMEKDIILTHMWPITFTCVPFYRESAIVNLADKACSIAEVSGFYWALKSKNRLRKLNLAHA